MSESETGGSHMQEPLLDSPPAGSRNHNICLSIMAAAICYRTTWPAKMCSMWVWITLIGVITGCVLRFWVFRSITIEASPTDTRVVSLPGAALMCQAAILDSQYNFQVAAFREFPRVNPLPSSVTQHKIISERPVNNHGSVYWGFYLLDGTTVRLTACGHQSIYRQYFIKGRERLIKMVQGCRGSLCYESVTNINKCPYRTIVHYTIRDSDDYYFYYNSNIKVWIGYVSVKFQLNRTNFEYYRQDKEYRCFAHERCRISMPLDPDYVLVYRAPDIQSGLITLNISYQPMVSMYVLLLGLPLVVLGISLCTIIHFKRTRSGQGASSQYVTGVPRGPGRLNQPRMEPPPCYEDLVNAIPNTPPPPYNTAHHM